MARFNVVAALKAARQPGTDCRMIFFGEKALCKATTEFIERYPTERNHQGLKNKIIQPEASVGRPPGEVECRERLGGLLRYYHRKAA